MRLHLTEVVKNLIIINVLAYFASFIAGTAIIENYQYTYMGRDAYALFFPLGAYFEPYQLITHMFMHAGDPMHILFNMLILAMLGPPLETMLGPKRFLLFYFICGFGAMALQLGVNWIEVLYFEGSVNASFWGASGAIMGVMVGYALKFPNQQLQLLFIPVPIRAVYLIMALIAWDTLAGFHARGSNIAHFAHLGGAIVGIILLEIWDRKK